jgi:predicted nucleic acid-binding protein
MKALSQRPDHELMFIEDLPEAGEALILDTCVYIDQLKARLPVNVDVRIRTRKTWHSSLALSELTFLFGRLDPADARTKDVLSSISDLLGAIPDSRVLEPSTEAMLRGSVWAGTMARLMQLDEGQRKKMFLDALMAAQATEENLLFVTRNVKDFDRLSQMDPRMKVAFYRV